MKSNIKKTFVHNHSGERHLAEFVKNMLQDEVYCTWMINNVKKTFIYNINKRKYSTEFVKNMLQDKIYCIGMINKVKKMFLHSVNENIRKCSAMHVIAMQKTYLDEVYFLKDKISQFKLIILKSQNVETLIHKNYNIVEK